MMKSISKQLLLKKGYQVGLIVFLLMIVVIFVGRNYFFHSGQKTAFGGNQFENANKLTELEYLSGVMYRLLNTDGVDTKKDLVKSYCDAILTGTKNDILKTKNEMYYDARSSLFVYNVCVYLDEDKYKDYFTDLEDLKSDKMLDSLKKDAKTNEYSSCDVEGDMEGCRLVDFYGDVFRVIMNDYSNMKLASIYGYSKMDIEDVIKNFSDEYFGEKQCGDSEIYYLNKEKLEDEESQHCSHPKTYKLLSESIKAVKQLLDDAKTVKPMSLLDGDEDKDYCLKDTDYDFFKCGFQDVDGNWKGFENVVQNELMYYNIFVTYYVFFQSNTLQGQQLSIGNIGKQIDLANSELSVAKMEVTNSQQAVNKMIKMLRGIYATYPIHIGLMAYYEDLKTFRKSFVKMYTPISQMYYKFRNVQDMRK